MHGADDDDKDKRVDYQKDIVPLLKKSCIACHSTSKPKGELNLESPASMLKGGESGPAIIVGSGKESMLYLLAAGLDDPVMPPKKNKVDAKSLNKKELALLARWIDEGAHGGASSGPLVHAGPASGITGPINWQPLPQGVNHILTVAITPDGQYAACNRANQIFVYNVPTGQFITRLTDPALLAAGIAQNPGVADRDLVAALAFSPDGQLLAAGGYRAVKIWRRPPMVPERKLSAPAPINAVAISPDGKMAAAACADNVIRLIDLGGNGVREIPGHDGPVFDVKWSRDGARLVSGSADKTLRVWIAASGEAFAKQDLPAEVKSVTFFDDNDGRVACGCADNIIRAYNLAPAANTPLVNPKEMKGHGGPVNALTYPFNNPKMLLSGSADGSAQLWSPDDGKSHKRFNHGGPVTAIAVRPDSQRYATAGADTVVKIWQADGKELIALKGSPTAIAALAQVEQTLNFAKAEVTYFKTALEASQKEHKEETEALKKATEARAAADKAFQEKTAAAKKAEADKQALAQALAEPLALLKKVTDDRAAAEKAQNEANSEVPKHLRQKQTNLNAPLQAAKTAKDAADKAVAALAPTADPNAVNAAKQAQAAAQKTFDEANAAKAAIDAQLAPFDAKIKAANDARGVADKAFNEATAKHKPDQDKWNAAEKAAKDATVEQEKAETAFLAADQVFQIKTANTQRELETTAVNKAGMEGFQKEQTQMEAQLEVAKKAVAEGDKPVLALAFSPDNNVLATAKDNGVILTWHVDTGAAAERLITHTAAVTALTFLPDGRLISGSADKQLFTWNLRADWKLERVIGTGDEKSPFLDRVLALDFSPDGKQLATAGGVPARAGEIKIWNVADGALVRELVEPHSDTVFGVQYSPNGKLLASCGADKFIKLFEADTGRFVRSLEGHTHHVLGVSWRRDGRAIASCGGDKNIKIWDLLTGEQKHNIQNNFKRDVTSIVYVNFKEEIIATSGDNQVRMLRQDGGYMRNFGGQNDFMQAIALTADGKYLIGGGQDSVLRVWEVANARAVRNFDPPKIEEPAAPATTTAQTNK